MKAVKINNQVSGTMNPEPSTKYPEPRAQNQVPSCNNAIIK